MLLKKGNVKKKFRKPVNLNHSFDSRVGSYSETIFVINLERMVRGPREV